MSLSGVLDKPKMMCVVKNQVKIEYIEMKGLMGMSLKAQEQSRTIKDYFFITVPITACQVWSCNTAQHHCIGKQCSMCVFDGMDM